MPSRLPVLFVIICITLVVISGIYVFIYNGAVLEIACMTSGGEWSKTRDECTSMATDKGLNNVSCTILGGAYDECASLCRGGPDPLPCPAVCVKSCSFKK